MKQPDGRIFLPYIFLMVLLIIGAIFLGMYSQDPCVDWWGRWEGNHTVKRLCAEEAAK